MINDVIIIGGGFSGMTAALYCLRNNKSVLLIEKDSFGGQINQSPKVENYPAYKNISGMELASNLFDQIMDLGVNFEIDEIQKIEKVNELFTVEGNFGKYQGRSIIIANGVKPRTTGLKEEEKFIGKGVYYCAVCDGPLHKDEEVYVLGDANSALQYAILLTNYASKVHIIALFDKLFGEKALIDKVNNNSKIDITYNFEIKEFIGKKNLEKIRFLNKANNEEVLIKTNNIFVAIGQVPTNDRFENLVELEQGFIVTDDAMQTKTPGVYASGDTRKKDVRQLVCASNDGAIAALSACKYLS